MIPLRLVCVVCLLIAFPMASNAEEENQITGIANMLRRAMAVAMGANPDDKKNGLDRSNEGGNLWLRRWSPAAHARRMERFRQMKFDDEDDSLFKIRLGGRDDESERRRLAEVEKIRKERENAQKKITEDNNRWRKTDDNDDSGNHWRVTDDDKPTVEVGGNQWRKTSDDDNDDNRDNKKDGDDDDHYGRKDDDKDDQYNEEDEEEKERKEEERRKKEDDDYEDGRDDRSTNYDKGGDRKESERGGRSGRVVFERGVQEEDRGGLRDQNEAYSPTYSGRSGRSGHPRRRIPARRTRRRSHRRV